MYDDVILTHMKNRMKRYCPNELEYFCDGKPNKSVNDKNTEYKPCPRRDFCELREKERMIKPLDKMAVITLRIVADIDDNEEIIGFKENIAAQLEEIPGVHAVGFISVKPIKEK